MICDRKTSNQKKTIFDPIVITIFFIGIVQNDAKIVSRYKKK